MLSIYLFLVSFTQCWFMMIYVFECFEQHVSTRYVFSQTRWLTRGVLVPWLTMARKSWMWMSSCWTGRRWRAFFVVPHHLRLDREQSQKMPKKCWGLQGYTFPKSNVFISNVDFQVPSLLSGRAKGFPDREEVVVSCFWNVGTHEHTRAHTSTHEHTRAHESSIILIISISLDQVAN